MIFLSIFSFMKLFSVHSVRSVFEPIDPSGQGFP